jgi:hypothetical protein
MLGLAFPYTWEMESEDYWDLKKNGAIEGLNGRLVAHCLKWVGAG